MKEIETVEKIQWKFSSLDRKTLRIYRLYYLLYVMFCKSSHIITKQSPLTCLNMEVYLHSFLQYPMFCLLTGSSRSLGSSRSCRSHWGKGNVINYFVDSESWCLDAGSFSLMFAFIEYASWARSSHSFPHYLPYIQCPTSCSYIMSCYCFEQ